MSPTRRGVLRASLGATGIGLAGCQYLSGCSDEVACFSFEYQGADDVPSRLTIKHTGGEQRLLADEVFVSEVSVDYESEETDTVAWAALDDDIGPDDTINGKEIQVKIVTGSVAIQWRQGDTERTIGTWVYADDVQ